MAATLGPTAPIAYVLCALAMGLIVLCMAEAGSRVVVTGGPYAYVEVAFGPFVGFLAGFLLWMVLTFAMAAVATVLVAGLGALVPPLSSRAAAAATLVAIYAVFAAVNILGVERGARVNTALTVAKILPLLLLIVGGLFAIDPANLAISEPPDLPRLARSSMLLIFAFAGIEAALVPGGEVKDPARTVPRALFIAMVTITLLYAGLQFVAQGVLGPALATSKAAPLAEAAGVALGGWARHLLLVGAVVSMLGHAGGMILATPRTLFAFARDGFLPRGVARLHPVHRSPVIAILVQCAIVSCSRSPAPSSGSRSSPTSRSWSSTPRAAWRPGSCAAATCAAGAHLSRCRRRPWSSSLACLVIGWMLTSVTRAEWVAFGVSVAAAAVIFAVRRRPVAL